MLEKYIPGIDKYYTLSESTRKNNLSEMFGLRLNPTFAEKLKRAAKKENRETMTVLRAIVLQALDKIDI